MDLNKHHMGYRINIIHNIGRGLMENGEINAKQRINRY